jgi:hypothetical protein
MGAALLTFATSEEIRAQRHIKPMHQYIAMRLVIEGGFLPEEITPHPPLISSKKGQRYLLSLDESATTTSERTVLGGLKTKQIDVVVLKPEVGPALCVSVKGTSGAFRNLTNRMEEAIGDCTNVHIMYPGVVYAFLHLIKVNRAADPDIEPNDVSVDDDGNVVEAVLRYHDILCGLAGRELVRNEISKYEAIGLLMVEGHGPRVGTLFADFPPSDSQIAFGDLFPRLYRVYDRRYPYVAASMSGVRRVEWDEASPAFGEIEDELGGDIADAFDYVPRIA